MLRIKTAAPLKRGGASKPPLERRCVKVFTKSEAEKANQRMKSRSRSPLTRKRKRSPSQEKLVRNTPVTGLAKQVMRRAEERRQRARTRQSKHLKRLRAQAGEMTVLELASVRRSTQEDYLRRLNAFYDFAAFHLLSLKSLEDLDKALVDYSDTMYLNGEDSHAGDKLKAALEFQRPEGVRTGRLELPRFKRALKGWRKLAPTQVRQPMLEFLKSAVSGVLLRMGKKNMALFNEATFSTYARPGELLRVFPADIVPKNDLRLRCDNPGCHGEGHCKQGRNLRRDAHPGRQESAVVGRSDGEVEPTEDARSKGARVIVGIQRAGVPGGVEACSGNLGNRGGSTKPVPKPTRRSKQRPTAETEESRQCISPREMGIRQQCASVQQTWKAAADLKPVQQGVGAIWGRCSEAFQGLLPKWYPKAPEEAGEEVLRESVKSNAAQNLHGKFFLSLFGGVGNHAKFWAHHGGLAAVVDFEDYSCNDLSKHSAWNSVLSDLDTVDVLGIDLPCNTFSRARRAPPWSKLPKPLRSQEHIFGLPNLNSSDFARVSRANTMLHGAIRCIRRCLKRNIPGFLENPSNSWVWQVPAIQRLIRHPAVHLIRVDQCQYNQQWRKPTKLLFWNVCPAHLKVCSGKGRCSRTNRAHLQLTGLVGKRFLTQHAQVYTKEFAAALMQSFMHPPPPPSMGHF